jgi:predicted transposase YbfD/YdcC
MLASPWPALIEQFTDLPDPRVERTRLHKLIDILSIAICAVICGAEGWDDFVAFGRAKQDWLKERLGLELPSGIPSADTFRRVFARLDPQALQTCFRAWTRQLHVRTQGEVIALDGKVVRHSFDTACEQGAIQMVSAWAARARLVLGQVKIEDKTNEIPTVPALLKLIDIRGCIVTTDAMSCQRATAATIIEQGGDYVLAVKDNQPTLYADIQARFAYAEAHGYEDIDHRHRTHIDKGHGRIETRVCDLLPLVPQDPLWGDVQQQWRGLRGLARITCTRQIADKVRTEVRYFISSLPPSAPGVLRAVRAHWGIENRLHYVLDVSMNEDASRIRRDHGAENFAVLRHIGLNLLRQEKTSPRGIKAKRKQAGWDNDYLALILISDEEQEEQI